MDFTSALYLGIHHPSWSLPPWDRLSLGKPAALEPPPGAQQVEKQLATLIGCERALLVSSTLHLFFDLFVLLGRHDVDIFIDESSYPISRWGAEMGACGGVKLRQFPRHNAAALRKMLQRDPGKPPVIVADGYCPSCGTAAPLSDYLDCAEDWNGLMVIDDTQALGIFGRPAPQLPYGVHGGGSMRSAGLSSERLVIGSSLAKAFGVPVSVLAGSEALVSKFESESRCRVHCSPPSVAVIAAAGRALEINQHCGAVLRSRLARLVSHLRAGLRRLGMIGVPGLFPVQPIALPEHIDAEEVHEALRRRGIHVVLHADRGLPRISFIVTARHTFSEIEEALANLEDVTLVHRKMQLRSK